MNLVNYEISASTAVKPKRVNKGRISISTQTTKRAQKVQECPKSFKNQIINENIRQTIQLKLKTKARFSNRNMSKYEKVWESSNYGIPKVRINYDTLVNKLIKIKEKKINSHWDYDFGK